MLDDLGMAVEGLATQVSNKIEGELDSFIDRLSDPSIYPFLVTPAHRLHAFYLLTFLVMALFVYLRQKPAGQGVTLEGCREAWLPKAVYRHPSSLLDLKFYLVNGVFLEIAFVTTLIGSFFGFAAVFEAVLNGLWGVPGAGLETDLAARILYVCALVLAADFGFFAGHYISHKVPLLWEFHKVHHSAEVLTPLTNYRFHPLDRILLGLFIGIATGAVKGAFGSAFSEMPAVIAVVLLLFNLTANLRHSHVWLSYGWHASHIFSSPAQHQIHHSTDGRHIDKNFGLMFSFWDWMARSLYVPREREHLQLGLVGGEHAEYDSLWRLYARPFARAWVLVIGPGARMSRARSDEER